MTDPRAESEVAPPMSSAVSGHKGRDRWICAILTHHDLMTPLELRVAVRLGIFFNCTTGRCDPGYARLAKELCIPPRSARRCVAALVERGFVGRDEGAGGSHDQKRNFSLFMPARGPVSTSSVQGTASVSSVETEKPASNGGPKREVEGTKTVGTGDQNTGGRGTVRRPTNEPDEPDEPAQPERVVFDDPRTSRVERESASNSTANFATIEGRPRSDQRAAEAALIEPIEAPSRPSNATAIGTAAASGRAAPATSPFAQVLSVYPIDRVGNEARAFFAFTRALLALGDLDAVLEGVASLKRERGAELPDLAEALAALVERDFATTSEVRAGSCK